MTKDPITMASVIVAKVQSNKNMAWRADLTEQNKKVEIDFFNQKAQSRDRGYSMLDSRGFQRVVSEFLKYLTPDKNLKVLDVGCGTGTFTAMFLKFGFELYGLDISGTCIERARNRYSNIEFEQGDIEDTRFEDSSFDVILLSGVLHHFPDIARAVHECYRILKKGGCILAYDPHRGNPFMRLHRCKDSPFYSSKGVTENEEPLSREKIREAFNLNDFSELKIYGISGVTFKNVEDKLARRLLSAYNFIELVLDNPLLRDKYGAFVITYARK